MRLLSASFSRRPLALSPFRKWARVRGTSKIWGVGIIVLLPAAGTLGRPLPPRHGLQPHQKAPDFCWGFPVAASGRQSATV